MQPYYNLNADDEQPIAVNFGNLSTPYAGNSLMTLLHPDKAAAISALIDPSSNLALQQGYQIGSHAHADYNPFQAQQNAADQSTLARQAFLTQLTNNAPKVRELASLSKSSSSGDGPKIDTDIGAVSGLGEGILKGVATGIGNFQQERAYRNRQQMTREIYDATQKAQDDASQKQTVQNDTNYHNALNDPAYGDTPEEREQNAKLDALNGWNYLKGLQRSRATTYTRTDNVDDMVHAKEDARVATFKSRREEFKQERGFDPFSDEDMKGRQFSAADVNAFKQYFPGSQYADELTTMQRNTKQDQAEATLNKTNVGIEQAKTNIERTKQLMNRTDRTPIPQPRQAATKVPPTSIGAQLKTAHDTGLISDEEYKARLLGNGGRGGRRTMEIPHGSGFGLGGGNAGKSIPAKPAAGGNRVDKFSSKWGF